MRYYPKELLSDYARLKRLAFPPSKEERVRNCARTKSWYQSNKRRARLRIHNWQKKNPEKLRLYQLKRTPESKRKASLKWGRKNKHKKRLWKQLNPDRVRASNTKRKALKRMAKIGDLKAIQKIYAHAEKLRRWWDVVVDHIIPLSKGGAHSPENLQIIFAYENLKKAARLDYTPTVVFC